MLRAGAAGRRTLRRSSSLYPNFFAAEQGSIVPFRGNGAQTYTAASTRDVIDWEGIVRTALSGEARFQGARRVRNYVAASEDITGATWTKGGTASASNATTLLLPANNDSLRLAAGSSPSNASLDSWTGSFKLSGNGTVIVAVSNGTDETTATVTLSSTPQIFSVTNSGGAGISGNAYTYIQRTAGTTATSVTIAWQQLEYTTGQATKTFGGYVSVGVESAPFHGANVDGVKYFTTLNGNTVASNVVTEATGAPITNANSSWADADGPFGIVTEPSQANVLGTTEAIVRTMADVGWVAGATMTLGSATGIDGVASAAASLTGGAVAATNTILFTTVLGSAARTYSAWVRRKTGTGTVSMTDNGGTNWTALTLTTTYQRFQLTRTQANPIVGFKIDTNLDAIEVDFNTIVAGSIAPALPVPVNVTTAADVLQYAAAGNISSTATTIKMDITPLTSLGSTTVFHWASYVDEDNYTAILSDGTNLIARKRIATTNHDATIAWTRTVNTLVTVAARFDTVNGVDVWLSGTKGTGDTTTTASQIGAAFQVGADGNGANQDYCAHRLLKVLRRSVVDSQIGFI